MTETIVIDPNCKDSMLKAAEKMRITVEALKEALAAFSRSMAGIGNHAIAAFDEVAQLLKKQKEADCDEQLQLSNARFEICQGRVQECTPLSRKPLQLESSYG